MQRWTHSDPGGSDALSVDAERQKGIRIEGQQISLQSGAGRGCKQGMHRQWRRGVRCLNES